MAMARIDPGGKLKQIGNQCPWNRGFGSDCISVFFISTIVTVLFVAQPFLGLLLIIFLGWLDSPRSYWAPMMLCLLGSAYIGLINTTKVPASDLLNYLEWFSRAEGRGLIEYLADFTREPVFYIWTWLISVLTGGDKHAFLFFTSWLCYSVITYSIVIVSRHFKIDARLSALVVLIFLFLPPLFGISAHLLRQFIAASLVALFFARRIAQQKSSWWLIAAAVFVHYSALIFVPLALLRVPRRFTPMPYLLFSAIALCLLYLVVKMSAGLLSQLPLFRVAFLRVAALQIPDVIGLSTNAIIFLSVILVLVFLNIGTQPRAAVDDKSGYYIENFNNSVLLLSLVILLSSLSIYTSEIAMRLFLYLYFMAGPIVLMFLRNRSWVIPLAVPVCMLNMIYFFLFVEFGVWQYSSVMQMLVFPAPLIWGAS